MFPRRFFGRYFGPRYFGGAEPEPAPPTPSSGVRLTETGEYVFGNLTARGELVIGNLTASGRFVFPVPTPIIPPPPIVVPSGGPITTRHRGWGFPIIRPHIEPRPRHMREIARARLYLSGTAIASQIARESAGAALQLRASAAVNFRANDDWLELFMLGVFSLDDLIALDAPQSVIDDALLLG